MGDDSGAPLPDPTGKCIFHSENPPHNTPQKTISGLRRLGFDVKIPKISKFAFLGGFYASTGANFYVKILRGVSCVDL